jgi:NitT/TauT family transport system substrate-binding protein
MSLPLPRIHRGSLAVTAAITALALTAAGCGGDDKPSSSGTGLEKTTLNVGMLPVGDVAQLQLAQDRGFFKAEGLTVKTQVLHVILVPKDSPIKTVKDLVGKKIGINVKHNVGSLLIQATLQPQGVKLDDEKNFVAMPFPQMEAALKSHSVDAVQAVEPFNTQLQKSIGARLLVDLSQGPTAEFPLAGYVSTEEFAKKNPKTVAAFQRAVGKAQAMLTDKAVLAKVIPEYTKITPDVAAVLHYGSYPTTLNAADLKRVSDLMVKYQYIQSPIDVNAFVGNSG